MVALLMGGSDKEEKTGASQPRGNRCRFKATIIGEIYPEQGQHAKAMSSSSRQALSSRRAPKKDLREGKFRRAQPQHGLRPQ